MANAEFWNARFGEAGFAYGDKPSDLLAEYAAMLPQGRVLCLAEGEGRNAVFLARLGHSVHAVDLSPVGLEKAQQLAAREGVRISTEVADLSERAFETDHWDVIVSIWAHMPSTMRRALHAQVVRALRPGGIFLLEAYTPRQPDMPGVGGPSREQEDWLMTLAALREELAGLELLHAVERERVVEEGPYHHGLSSVVQIVARRPAVG